MASFNRLPLILLFSLPFLFLLCLAYFLFLSTIFQRIYVVYQSGSTSIVTVLFIYSCNLLAIFKFKKIEFYFFGGFNVLLMFLPRRQIIGVGGKYKKKNK